MRLPLLLSLPVVLALPACCATVVIDTFSQVNSNAGTFPGQPTWGQSVTVPTGTNFLQSFSFRVYINNPGQSGVTALYPYVMAWTGTTATGPVLFKGPFTSIPQDGFVHQLDFATNVPVSEGGQYILFVSADEVIPNSPRTAFFQITDPTAYTGGATFRSFASDFSQVTTTPWIPGTFELGFQAVFTTTPEPASGALIGLSLAGLIWAARKRPLAGFKR